MSNIEKDVHVIEGKLKAAFRVQHAFGLPFINSVSVSDEPAVLQFDLPKDTSLSVVGQALGKDIEAAKFAEIVGGGLIQDSKRYRISIDDISTSADIAKTTPLFKDAAKLVSPGASASGTYVRPSR